MATLIGFVALITVAQADIDTLAEQAGVDPTDLQGAVNTTKLPPDVYLHMTGETPQLEMPYGVWDRLAECEASGDWHNARNPKYKGGIQADAAFWARYGGLAFAPAPHLASREQQIIVAQRGQKVQGWSAWPVCSKRLGLR